MPIKSGLKRLNSETFELFLKCGACKSSDTIEPEYVPPA
jgi:hypothetical protein